MRWPFWPDWSGRAHDGRSHFDLRAMQRLQAIIDLPGPAAQVDQQLPYHATLGLLALHGKHKTELDGELEELRRLSDSGRCAPCANFLLLLLVLRVGYARAVSYSTCSPNK